MDCWLQVIPQLIARIHTPTPQVRKGVQDLLSTLGKVHPHALVWPLTVASKSNSRSRQLAAQQTLAKMRQHSVELVDQVRHFRPYIIYNRLAFLFAIILSSHLAYLLLLSITLFLHTLSLSR